MSVFRYLRDTAVFALCYVALDWASYFDALGPFNITPWNPQAALAVAWMLLGGMRQWPLVLATILAADVLVRGAPGGHFISLLTSVALAGGYAWMAWLLRALLRGSGLRSLRELNILVAVSVGGAALVGACYIGVLRGAGLLADTPAPQGWLRFWVGDAVGILVTAPLLLAVADGERRRALVALLGRAETYLQVGVVGTALWLIFAGLGGDPAHHFYLLFLPLIWVAVRSGMGGAIFAIAIIQLGVVLGIHHAPAPALPVIELQALVAGLTLTGLYLGVMMDERERAVEVLKQSLRLATAGEMAGAIAHEVNQPLTALANYGRAGQLLLEAGRSGELAAVLEKMLGEAQRASEVVRRLRDFFREGTTRLERVPVGGLLEFARRTGEAMKDASGIEFTVRVEEGLPELLVDRLQIELVLRNVVANAVEAIRLHGSAAGRVSLSAQRDDAHQVCITVSDSGPGVSASRRGRLFQPFESDKPSGMGLGLAVSRAIAEAHGGRLEAAFGQHGEFQLWLPVEGVRG